MTNTIKWTIRACDSKDADVLLDFWRQAETTPSVTDTLDDVQRMIKAATVLVAEADGKLVGSILGVFDGWRANIYRLAVQSAYRRRGIAAALVGEVEKRLVQQGAKKFSAIVEADHSWVTSFWEALGYAAEHWTIRYTLTV